jgi:phage-related tail fiber protein
VLYIPIYSTSQTYHIYTVQKDGYTPFTSQIGAVPAKGQIIDLYATLNPATGTATVTAAATTLATGGYTGWYRVHGNVDGSTVSFDNDPKGQILQGTLNVRVNLSAIPYKTFTVYKAGYIPYTGVIDQFPGKGETLDLYATLKPTADATAAATTQKSPVPAGIGLVAVVVGAGIALAGRK